MMASVDQSRLTKRLHGAGAATETFEAPTPSGLIAGHARTDPDTGGTAPPEACDQSARAGDDPRSDVDPVQEATLPDHDIQRRSAHVADVLKVMRALGAHHLSPSQEGSIRGLLRHLLPGPRQGDLFEEPPARDEERLVEAARAVVRDEPAYRELDVGLAIKVALVVSHVRAGRWERIGAGEVGMVATILRRQIPTRAYEGSGDGSHVGCRPDDGPVEFAFPWHPRRLRRIDRLGLAMAHAELHEVEPVDAPVACSLWTPEGRLDVRRLGPAWLRPVLSPGSWKPVTVAGFRAAARDGTAWRDNPFLARQRGSAPVFHMLDYAGSRPVSKGDEERVAEERNACLVRAGHLHVVDGVVHVHTMPPLAGFVTSYVDGMPSTHPAWRMGELGSTQGMDTFGRPSSATWFNGSVMPDGAGAADPDGCLVDWTDWMGVVRLMTPGRTAGRNAVRPRTPAISDLVTPHDLPDAAPDAVSALRVAAKLAMRLLPLADVLDRSAGVDPCVRLKRVLAGLVTPRDAGEDAGDEAVLMADIRTRCADVTDHVGPMTDPRAGMWAYVAALASHAAERALNGQDDSRELEDLCL